VSGLLLNKEVTELPVRFHGPKNLKQYMESIRPFLDKDHGAAKYPVSVVEMTYDKEGYEDEALRVRYIPLFGSQQLPTASKQTIDTAFLVEIKVHMICVKTRIE